MKQNQVNINALEEAAKAHYEFLLHRFAKDQGYKNAVKDLGDQFIHDINADAWNLGDDYNQVNEYIDVELTKETEKWFEYFKDEKIYIGSIESRKYYSVISNLNSTHVKLPWPRTFEAELEPDLTLKLQKDELLDYMEFINGLDLTEEDYTPNTWKLFEEALLIAESLLVDDSATPEMKAKALGNLEDMFDRLIEKAKNKNLLLEQIEGLQSLKQENYTKKSWTTFQSALKNAQNTYDDPNASEETVTKSLDELKVASKALEKKEPIAPPKAINKTDLEKLINDIKHDIQGESAYTKSSWDVFNKAFEYAKNILNDEQATETEVEMALSDLQTAYEKLKENENSPTEFENDKDNEKDKSEGERLPNTATPYFNILLFGVIFIIFGVCMLIYTYRKRKAE